VIRKKEEKNTFCRTMQVFLRIAMATNQLESLCNLLNITFQLLTSVVNKNVLFKTHQGLCKNQN